MVDVLSGRPAKISCTSPSRRSLFFHAAMQERCMKGGASASSNFDLTLPEIKDHACKEGTQRTFFVEGQTFLTRLEKKV